MNRDRGQMADDRFFVTLSIVVVILIMAFVGWQVVGAATGPEMQQYLNESAEWCGERGGELHNARVIGEHGGLHCELPNGTSVHMHEVVEYG